MIEGIAASATCPKSPFCCFGCFVRHLVAALQQFPGTIF
jgi:hypothetical protein